MQSYLLSIAIVALVSALYAFQNSADITVRFLFFERSVAQGVWDVILFAGGAALMWIFSVIASFEIRSVYRKKLKEKDKKIEELETEKKTWVHALAQMPQAQQTAPPEEPKEEPKEAPQKGAHDADDQPEAESADESEGSEQP